MNTNAKIEQIKDVAIYLRKSRGDEEDLSKHREELIDLCNENKWRYVEFAEVGSSADIEYRPELKRMLNDIKNDLFDAVVVIDKDRLSREGMGQAVINQALIDNDCLIVTPSKIYDLSNDNDVLMSEVEDLMARFEYRMIKKRLRRGKKRGAKRGEWTNGTPPFPYEYDPDRKGLVINEENKRWYRFMIDRFLEGKPFYEIAWELNRMGVKTKRGGIWHENSIRRLLLDETHLGHIISNKTSGSYHKNRKTQPFEQKPKDEWIVVKNCHEPVKTEEEHREIQSILSKRRRVPISSKQVKLPFTGIIKCGKCGKTMQVYRRKLAKSDSVYIKQCQKSDPFGNRCKNSGGNSDGISELILIELKEYRNKCKEIIQKKEKFESQKEIEYLENKIFGIQKEIEKKKESIERIDLAFEEGIYDIEKYKERLTKVKEEISKLEKEKEAYEYDKNKMENTDIEEKLNAIEKAIALIESGELSWKKMNELYKVLGIEVIWIKEGQGKKPIIEINFTK